MIDVASIFIGIVARLFVLLAGCLLVDYFAYNRGVRDTTEKFSQTNASHS